MKVLPKNAPPPKGSSITHICQPLWQGVQVVHTLGIGLNDTGLKIVGVTKAFPLTWLAPPQYLLLLI